MTWHPEIDHALASLRAESEEAASDAGAALGWLVGEGGPELLSEGRLQEFLLYVLPAKFLMPVEDQLCVAKALGRVLELLRFHRYAELCRSPRNEEILRAWQEDQGAGLRASRQALSSSVVEPPDVGDLRWGAVMGPWESRAMEELSAALELAAQAGEVRRGTRGWREAQRAFAWRWLNVPQPGFESMSPYERLVRERLEAWAGRKPSRRGLLGPLVERLVPPVTSPENVTSVVEPVQWLLLRIRTGVALTAKGNLNREFVRRAARELGWKPSHLFEPTGEEDVPPLQELHRLARSIRAIRRSGRREAVTQKGVRWATDDEDLWRAVGRYLTEGESWEAAVAELTLGILLTRPPVDVSVIADEVAPALVESGWRKRGWRPGNPSHIEARAVRAGVWTFLRKAEVLGMLQRPPWGNRPISLTELGRATALEALRARGIAPKTPP